MKFPECKYTLKCTEGIMNLHLNGPNVDLFLNVLSEMI